MKKVTLYIIPGVGESTRSKNYKEIIRSSQKLGHKVIPVNIRWSAKMDVSDFISQAKEIILDDGKNCFVLGFSLGAYIAAILAPKKKIAGLIFCSMSPYFKSNLKDIPLSAKRYWGKKMINSFKKYNFPSYIHKRGWFLIGSEDWDFAIEANKHFYKNWSGKKDFFLIRGAGHELKHPNYIKQVKKIIGKL